MLYVIIIPKCLIKTISYYILNMSVSQTILKELIYPPERVIESRLVNLPATAKTPYMQLGTIDISKMDPRMVWIRQLGFNRATGAALNTIIEGTVAGRSIENILPFGAAMPTLDAFLRVDQPFDYNAFVSYYNSAVGPLANFQSSVVWEARKYTVAEKLAQGVSWEALSDREQRLAEKWEIKKKLQTGELPMEYPKGALFYKHHGNFNDTAAALGIAEVTVAERTVPAGYKAVLTRIQSTRPTANVGNLTINVYRDTRSPTPILQIFPFCIPDYIATPLAEPLELWMPALELLRVSVQSTTGAHAAIINILATIEIRELTIWDKIAWNLTKQLTAEETQLIRDFELEEKCDAGIYTLLTPCKS